MAGLVVRKSGIILLTIVKGILQTVSILFKMLCWGLKLLLLVFAFISRGVLSFVGVGMRR